MALVQKLHEQFSQPLSSDYWFTDTMSGVVVSNGYARIPTNLDPTIYVQPKWFKPDGLPLALHGKSGENWGEFEFEYKITPRSQRQSGATNVNEMGTYLWNTSTDGLLRYLRIAMWSRSGLGTSSMYALRLSSSSDTGAVLYENLEMSLVNTPVWIRGYLNKANGTIRLHTSANGTTWTQRYSGVDASHATDGDASVYLTPLAGDANKYFDVDDFIIRTSNDEVFPNNARSESSVSEIELSVTHHLEIDSSRSSTNSSSPVPAEGGPKVPVLVYGFGGGWGSATGYAADFYGSGLRRVAASSELDIADTVIDHEVQGVKLKQLHGLLPASAKHPHVVDSILLRQEHNLLVENAINWYESPELSLLEDYLLLTDSTLHSMYAPNVPVSGAAFLGVQNAYHALQSANAALTQLHRLGTQDSLHGLPSGELGISESRLLAIQGSLHGLKSLAGSLYQNHITTPQGASHGLSDSAILLKQEQLLDTRSGHHNLQSPTVALAQASRLGMPHASKHLLHSDNTYISQLQILEILNTLHRLHSTTEVRVVNWDELNVFFGGYIPDRGAKGPLHEAEIQTGNITPAWKQSGELEATSADEGIYTPNYTQKGKF